MHARSCVICENRISARKFGPASVNRRSRRYGTIAASPIPSTKGCLANCLTNCVKLLRYSRDRRSPRRVPQHKQRGQAATARRRVTHLREDWVHAGHPPGAAAERAARARRRRMRRRHSGRGSAASPRVLGQRTDATDATFFHAGLAK
jgi:hypothetical protein